MPYTVYRLVTYLHISDTEANVLYKWSRKEPVCATIVEQVLNISNTFLKHVFHRSF